MKSAKGHHHHQEEEEEEDEELGTKKDDAPSNNNPTNNTNNVKDGKNIDKANAIRSKHSVTEQRRRSKINERFQILRDLIPHSDQKRDTASFLLEVIQYVQYLQEKVQKYEGSYQAWDSETTKLMPWRNSHWRIPSLVGHPQAMKNGSGQGPIFPGRFEENNIAVSSNLQSTQNNPIESSAVREAPGKTMDLQAELGNRAMDVPIPLQTNMPVPVPNDGGFSFPLPRPSSDSQSTGCPGPTDALNQQEPIVEGGTISISSVYSQGLLNSLSQALQTAGVDLSQATISVQINLGKQANRGVASGILTPKDPENPIPSADQQMGHFQDSSNAEDLDQAHKRLKIQE